jgi:nucleotide-binding universal stress UspA family protein
MDIQTDLATAPGPIAEAGRAYRSVLVPLDGSPLAETVLPPILAFAHGLDLEVVLFRVIPVFPPGTPEGARGEIEERSRQLRQEAEGYLRSVAERLEGRARFRIAVRRGEAATEIVEAAADEHADLIAMTTHGRSGLSRLLFGSVAEAVLRQAETPIFLKSARESEAGRLAA